MPFHGVLPQRQHIFQPEPITDIGVNDAHAWRLNPKHRKVYDKLFVALSQGLNAAPCGVDPLSMGVKKEVFVKPITNLSGMSLEASSTPAEKVPNRPGSFWCELLEGQQKSTDCLVKDGKAYWFAHTLASEEKNESRPVYWEIGAPMQPSDQQHLSNWIAQHLSHYTGLCNFEQIGDSIIEVHLRGSNGFFDFYGADFIPAWVNLIDKGEPSPPPPIPGGTVVSLFSDGNLNLELVKSLETPSLTIQIDHQTPNRLAIIRAKTKQEGLNCLEILKHQSEI